MQPSGRRSGRAVRLGTAGVLVLAAALTPCTSTPDPARQAASRTDAGGPSPDGGARRPGADAPGSADPAEQADGHAPPRPRVRAPSARTVTLPGQTAAELALATSGALFEEAPVVVVAADGDLTAQSRAATAAVALGAPLLLSEPARARAPGATTTAPSSVPPTSPAAGAALGEELARLRTEAVLAVGSPAVGWARRLDGGPEVVAAPDDPAALARVIGADVAPPQPADEADLAEAVARLPRRRPPLLQVGGPTPGREGATGTALPATRPARPLDDLLAVVEGHPRSVAAAATARGSGARVLTVAGGDPRADPAAIAALAEAPPGAVLAVGSAFGPAERLRSRIDVAATGAVLPGGGQVLFPGRRMAALYGHPGTAALGCLGEQPLPDAVARAKGLAAEYDRLGAGPVVPAFEIIATVASGAPGADGNYANESAVAELEPWVDAAGEAGVYVVLDIQPGRTDFLTQARRYEELLAEPHVGLALDPEWRLGPDQRHLEQIGAVGADEINAVADWLATLTRQHRLPQKLLLLHQFQTRMIGDRHRVDTGHDELAVLIHADGFGTTAQKLATWNRLRADPPRRVWWGWKNFYDEDRPMLDPAQTMGVDPGIVFVSYQ